MAVECGLHLLPLDRHLFGCPWHPKDGHAAPRPCSTAAPHSQCWAAPEALVHLHHLPPALPHFLPRSFQWREECNKCHNPKSEDAQTVTATVVGGGGLAPSRQGERPRRLQTNITPKALCGVWAGLRVRARRQARSGHRKPSVASGSGHGWGPTAESAVSVRALRGAPR